MEWVPLGARLLLKLRPVYVVIENGGARSGAAVASGPQMHNLRVQFVAGTKFPPKNQLPIGAWGF